MTTPPAESSAPASPTAGALLVATAPPPAPTEAEALLWRDLRGRPLAGWALAALVGAPGLERPGHGASANAPGLERPGHEDEGMNALGIYPLSVRAPAIDGRATSPRRAPAIDGRAASSPGRQPLMAAPPPPRLAALVIVARAEREAAANALAETRPAWAPPARVALSAPGWRAALAAGLAALPEECAWVIAHDAARPLLTPDMLAAGYAAALASEGVALAGEPVSDTLKRVAEGRVMETPPRASLRRLTPPLVIRRELLARALTAATVDDAGLAEIALAGGARVATYAPTAPNPAVASEAGWPLIEALLAARATGS